MVMSGFAYNKFKDNSGFTLLEVLIAVVIFTIGILSVNAMQISSMKGNSTSSRITGSVAEVSGQTELFSCTEYADINSDSSGDIAWVITEDDPFIGVKSVTTTVTKMVGGTPKRVTVTYMKADSI